MTEGAQFGWAWAWQLKDNEYFDVRIWKEGQPHYGIGWTKDPWFTLGKMVSGKYFWSIAVIRHTGTNPDGTKEWVAVSEESEVRSFFYSPPQPVHTPTLTGTPFPTMVRTSTPIPTATMVPTRTRSPSPTPYPTHPAEIIIDNNDSRFSTASYQDGWQQYVYIGGQHYGDTHFYNPLIGTGQDTATWSFTVPQPGKYQVYAWWWEGEWRPSDVPYTIHHLGGVSTVRVNQQTNGGRWNLLGTFDFEKRGAVVVSDDASSGRDVVADAIRLVYFGPLQAAASVQRLIKGPGRPVYLLENGVRHWIPNSQTFETMGYRWDQVIEVTWEELLSYPFGDPLPIISGKLTDGELVKGAGVDVYLIEAEHKRRIANWSVFLNHGFKEIDIAHVTDRWLANTPNGPPVVE